MPSQHPRDDADVEIPRTKRKRMESEKIIKLRRHRSALLRARANMFYIGEEALEKEMHPDWNIEVSFPRCRQ